MDVAVAMYDMIFEYVDKIFWNWWQFSSDVLKTF